MDCLLEGERHLPSDFADRLVAHVLRRRRRERRVKIIALIAALVAASTAFLGFLHPEAAQGPGETRLVAARTGMPKEQVSGWMILGAFRECFECFKKNKPNKRKEEK